MSSGVLVPYMFRPMVQLNAMGIRCTGQGRWLGIFGQVQADHGAARWHAAFCSGTALARAHQSAVCWRRCVGGICMFVCVCSFLWTGLKWCAAHRHALGNRKEGWASVLYDPAVSERGALLSVARAPRQRDPFDFQVCEAAVVVCVPPPPQHTPRRRSSSKRRMRCRCTATSHRASDSVERRKRSRQLPRELQSRASRPRDRAAGAKSAHLAVRGGYSGYLNVCVQSLGAQARC